MRILHVTPWYPGRSNSHEALWIKRHVESVASLVDYHFVLHLEVKPSNRFSFFKGDIEHGIQRKLEIPFQSWFLAEIIAGVLMIFYLFRLRGKKFDIINFHIAYPLMIYWHLIKKMIRKPAVIVEHWSAYHFNFGISPSLKLGRIQRIFRQNIPVFAVSNALAEDIRVFSEATFKSFILPNVVDDTIYFPLGSKRNDNFFMISQWKWPKKPLVIFEAFKEFTRDHPNFSLTVAGYGQDYPAMETWIEKNQMRNKINLIGRLEDREIASHLSRCKALIHCSEYETFSVVCAEAVSCHTPVLASNVGGIKEIIRKGEGILVDSLEPIEWADGMRQLVTSEFLFATGNRFSRKTVGAQYKMLLQGALAANGGDS